MYNLIICQWFNLVKCVIFQNGKLGGWKINANEFVIFFYIYSFKKYSY